jgi:hypothetical protein
LTVHTSHCLRPIAGTVLGISLHTVSSIDQPAVPGAGAVAGTGSVGGGSVGGGSVGGWSMGGGSEGGGPIGGGSEGGGSMGGGSMGSGPMGGGSEGGGPAGGGLFGAAVVWLESSGPVDSLSVPPAAFCTVDSSAATAYETKSAVK